MNRELMLSEKVRDFIQTVDDDFGLTKEQRAEFEQTRQLLNFIVDHLVKAREVITDNKLEFLERCVENERAIIEDLLDARFTRDVIDEISGYVRRTLELSQMKCTTLPSKTTNGYLREAVRTYVLGLPQASVALSRAALEQALKEGIGYQLTNTFVKMNDLLQEAMDAEVIDDANRQLAREVADAADDVLHEKPTTLSNALDVLIKMRGILHFIYSAG
jgi:hypothetical protein